MATAAAQTVQQTWLQWALRAFDNADENYQKFEDYYVGDHELQFATDRWESVFGSVFEEFADNWCGVVIDSLAQRLEINGWTCEEDKDAAKLAEDIWERENLAAEEEDLTTQTLVKGDGYLIGWPNPDNEEEAQLFYNDALDVNVYYDPQNRRRTIRACKKYLDVDQNMHIMVYYPSHTDHFVTTNQSGPNPFFLVQTESLSTSDALPAGWEFVEAIPNATGILPVFHFKNKMVNSTHGISEIKQVIPIQNAVNKMLMDMMIASEFGAFRQKYMAGGGHPKDGWKSGPERIWATTDATAKFGEFSQTDLEPYVRVIEMLIAQIAKITQTPMHYLRTSGDMPSGEALKAAESGLVKKAGNRQKQFGERWSAAMSFAVALERSGSGAFKKLETRVQPVWKSPETRHDLEQGQVAQLKSVLGIPLERLWADHFGYSEKEIAEFKKSNQAVAAQVLAAVIAQSGQIPPGADGVSASPDDIIKLIKTAGTQGALNQGEGPVNLSQILSLLPKGVTSQTTAGEATTKPQPHTSPPGSPTRRGSGFKD